MGTEVGRNDRSLDEVVAFREPLINIVVIFKEGVGYELATAAVNSPGPDKELPPDVGTAIPDGGIDAVTAEEALMRCELALVP